MFKTKQDRRNRRKSNYITAGGKKGQTPCWCQIPHLKTHLYTVFKYSAINYAIKCLRNLHLGSLNVKYWVFYFYILCFCHFILLIFDTAEPTCYIFFCCIVSKIVKKRPFYFQSLLWKVFEKFKIISLVSYLEWHHLYLYFWRTLLTDLVKLPFIL